MSSFLAKPTSASIEYLFAFLIHNKEVFNEACRYLPSLNIVGVDRVYQLLFHILFRKAEKEGNVPSRSVLECEFISNVEASPSCSDLDIANAKDFINWIYDQVPVGEIQQNSSYGLELLRLFLQDQLRRRLQQETSELKTDESEEDLPSVVRQISDKFAELSLIGKAPSGEVDPSLWIEQDRARFFVGLPFWDAYTITYPGDVNVLLGPTGAGKTTLALQLLTYAAKTHYYGGPNRGLFVYLGYEDTAAEAGKRVVSCAAKIPRERLANLKSIDELSTKNNLQPYELEFYRENPSAPRMGELERYLAAMEYVKPTIRVFDCSGIRQSDGVVLGNGGIPEIKALLDKVCSSSKLPLKMLIIDWAGMVVRRFLQSKSKFNDKNIILELENFVDRIYQDIALPNNAVVFVVHQLRGQICKQAPTAKVSHSDAAWCSNFAVNAWNAVCIGTKDEESNAITLSWTKTRRGVGKSQLVCVIDDKFNRLVTDDSYYLDEITKRIVREERVYGKFKTETSQARS